MEKNCYFEKMRGTVTNPDLSYLGFINIGFYANSKPFAFVPSASQSSNVIKVRKGTVYSDEELTTPITDINCTTWSEVYLFQGTPRNDCAIAVNASIIACLGGMYDIYGTSETNVFNVKKSDLLPYGFHSLNLKNVEFIDTDKSIEPLFISIYKNYIKKRNDTRFERTNISTDQFWPTISNTLPRASATSTWSLKYFNGIPFYEKYLIMATDIENDTFYLYNKVTISFGNRGTLNNDDIVASYNNATGEWNYYE